VFLAIGRTSAARGFFQLADTDSDRRVIAARMFILAERWRPPMDLIVALRKAAVGRGQRKIGSP
jgi:hypothetical protein